MGTVGLEERQYVGVEDMHGRHRLLVGVQGGLRRSG
jgi:hypothetical protein